MNAASPQLPQVVTETLARAAGRVSKLRQEWSFNLGNGKALPVTASQEDHWLRLAAPVALERGTDQSWRALRLNASLPGALRIVRHPRPLGLMLQGELSLEPESSVPERLETLCAGFRAAVPLLHGKPDASRGKEAVEKEDGTGAALADLARENGWTLEPREGNRWAAELDAPGLLSQAWLERHRGGRSLWIEVLRAPLSEASRNAAGLFLLTLTAALRQVRGSADDSPSPALRLEVRLPVTPTAVELDLALAALSLACRLGMRELKGLADAELAAAYLNHMTTEN